MAPHGDVARVACYGDSMSEAARKFPGDGCGRVPFMGRACREPLATGGRRTSSDSICQPDAWSHPERVGPPLGNHLAAQAPGCSVITNAGTIPRVRADANFRIPDLAVTCSDYQEEEYDVSEPVLMVEILSPTNKTETWTNVWAYTTIPSVREVLILHSVRVRAELLRRDTQGNWPERALVIEDGILELESMDFRVPLAAIYRRTRIARGTPRRGAV
jgi:Uma2 family endonuclease